MPIMSQARSEAKEEARFLITGAKGFIGAWTAKNLVERGDHPYFLDVKLD